MNYIDKLNSHQRMNVNDLKDFCLDQAKILQLEDYVDNVKLEEVFMARAEYDASKKSINIDNSTLKRAFRCFLFEDLKAMEVINCNKVDIFNLKMIYLMFHELWHAVQAKIVENNPNDVYSKSIKFALKLQNWSGSFYRANHNSYFHEYDAVIHSLILTLNFAKNFDFDKNALVAMNRFFAKDILEGYNDYENRLNGYYGYNYPIEFFSFTTYMVSLGEQQKEIVDELLRYYEDKHDTNTELENFFEGNRLKLQTLQKLRDIRSGRVRTTNLFASIHLELDYDDPKIVSKM